MHSIETYEREDGKRGWRVKYNDEIVGTDGSQGYNNEEDALSAFFGLFFGAWNTSFLEYYEKWQDFAGQQDSPAPEPFVRQGENEHATSFQNPPPISVVDDGPRYDDGIVDETQPSA